MRISILFFILFLSAGTVGTTANAQGFPPGFCSGTATEACVLNAFLNGVASETPQPGQLDCSKVTDKSHDRFEALPYAWMFYDSRKQEHAVDECKVMNSDKMVVVQDNEKPLPHPVEQTAYMHQVN